LLRLLVTASDAAAAFHLLEVVKAAREDPRFDVRVAAQGPALKILATAGVELRAVTVPRVSDATSSEARALLAEARAVLDETRPDLILSGLSTPFDGGFDEAVLAERKVPAYLMQDFWGELNSFFGRDPDVCFVLDAEAAVLSNLRSDCKTMIVGSPRHAAYDRMDSWGMRKELREALHVAIDAPLVGLFGQALHANPGYRRTIDVWCEAVREIGAVPLYKPHPRESSADVSYTVDLLARHQLNTRIPLPSTSVEAVISACDVVSAAFSNCLYDAAFLNHFSERPLVSPVALFFDKDIVSYFRSIVNLDSFPYLKSGLVEPVSEAKNLVSSLASALRAETKHRYWTNARANLEHPVRAVSMILDELAERRLL
jgi:hypothetical protein